MKDCHLPHHPSHQDDLPKLKKAIGQLEGIQKMILDERYCPDILIQIKAAEKAIKGIERSILQRHLEHCVANAVQSKNKNEIENKIQEIGKLLKQLN